MNENYLPAELLKSKLTKTNRELQSSGEKLDIDGSDLFGGNVGLAKAIDITKYVCSLFIPVIGELEPISDQKVAQDLNWIFTNLQISLDK